MNVGHIITGMKECMQNICISLLLLHIHDDGLLIVHLFFIEDCFIVYCLYQCVNCDSSGAFCACVRIKFA